MKTKEIKLFNFSDLSKESKEKAIQNHIKNNKQSIQEIKSQMFYEDLIYSLETKEPLTQNFKKYIINEISNAEKYEPIFLSNGEIY